MGQFRTDGMRAIMAAVGLLLATMAQASEEDSWLFEVFLDDRPIGQQRFVVQDSGDGRRVAIEARFDVDFLFFDAYDYAHRNTEYWQDGCLQSLDAETDDNGTQYRLRGERGENGFKLRVNGQVSVLPGCVMTFAYWNPAILKASRLLNTQDGRYMPVSVASLGTETLAVADSTMAATRYRLEAEGLSIDLWYAEADGRWLKLESLVDNNRLVFKPRIHGDQMAALR